MLDLEKETLIRCTASPFFFYGGNSVPPSLNDTLKIKMLPRVSTDQVSRHSDGCASPCEPEQIIPHHCNSFGRLLQS